MVEQQGKRPHGVQNEFSMASALFKLFVLCWVSVCVVPTAADAFPAERNGDTPLNGAHSALAVFVGVGSLLGLVYALFNCSCCDESSLLKYEETPEEDEAAVVQDDDFSPPTESTPVNAQKETIEESAPVVSLSAAASVDTSAVEAYNDPRLQFSRDQLNYIDEIGSGWFGKALRGEAEQIHPGMRKTRVVVRQLKDSATPDEQVLFVKEVQPYREVNHPNVLMLLGQCLETSPLLLILEYAPNGDLKAYLQKNRDKVQSFAQDDVQLRMATNVISGLLWLHQKDFVHIDLAARNCQVSADDVIKIGDYGISLEQYPDDYYKTKDGRHAVPIRWLGPEVINAESENIEPKKVTKQSNIWSYGVIMLELSTGGDTPYPNLSDEEVLQKIVRERQVEVDKPNLAMKYADRWFETMSFCFLDEADRPSTKEVNDLIQHLNTYKDQLNQADFDSRWNALRPAAAREADSNIDIPQPQVVVEEEITVTPESQQLSESPPQMDDVDDEDFEPRAGEVTNPFMKEGPADTSTPMPADQQLLGGGEGDDSSTYVTATGSFLDAQDETGGGEGDKTAEGEGDASGRGEDFNTLVEAMMEDTIESLKADEKSGLGDDSMQQDDEGDTKQQEDDSTQQEDDSTPQGDESVLLGDDSTQQEDDIKQQEDESVLLGDDSTQQEDDIKQQEDDSALLGDDSTRQEHDSTQQEDYSTQQGDDIELLGDDSTRQEDDTTEQGDGDDSTHLGDDRREQEDDGEPVEDQDEQPGGVATPDDEGSRSDDGGEREESIKEDEDTVEPISQEESKDENQNEDAKTFHSDAGITIAEPPAAPITQPREESPPEPTHHGYAQVEKKGGTTPKKLTITVSSGHKSKTLEIDNLKPMDEVSPTPEIDPPEPSQGGAGDAPPTLTFTIAGKKQEEEEPAEATNGHAADDGLEKDDDNVDCKLGKLDFSVVYNDQKRELQCMIHRAHNLKAMDPNGFSDPYVKLHILPRASSRSTKLRTKTKYKTLDPEFDEELTYHGIIADDLHTKTLRLSVWDEDALGHNDFIGEYLLPLKKLPINETKSYSIFLQDKSEEDEEISESERGKILLGLQYYKKTNQISVKVIRCAGLFAMDSNGFSDPYVKLYLQPDPQKKTKKKTATKKKTLNPEYKETFMYKLPPEDIHTKTLEVTVWDKDVGSNDYIGGIQLGSTTRGDRRQHWTDAIENPENMIERWHILSETQFNEDD